MKVSILCLTVLTIAVQSATADGTLLQAQDDSTCQNLRDRVARGEKLTPAEGKYLLVVCTSGPGDPGQPVDPWPCRNPPCGFTANRPPDQLWWRSDPDGLLPWRYYGDM